MRGSRAREGLGCDKRERRWNADRHGGMISSVPVARMGPRGHAVLALAFVVLGAAPGRADNRPGVPPSDGWSCPEKQPIKGNFTTYNGERCIYHMPGGSYYSRTKPERCYATEADARQDGCRRSKR